MQRIKTCNIVIFSYKQHFIFKPIILLAQVDLVDRVSQTSL